MRKIKRLLFLYTNKQISKPQLNNKAKDLQMGHTNTLLRILSATFVLEPAGISCPERPNIILSQV